MTVFTYVKLTISDFIADVQDPQLCLIYYKLHIYLEIIESNDNISYVKKMMQIAEVRHLKGVRSSFGIAD